MRTIKLMCAFLLLLVIQVSLFGKGIELSFEKKDSEPADVYMEKLIQGQKDTSTDEEYDYYVKTLKREKAFLDALPKSNDSFFIGDWYLCENDAPVKNKSFDLSDHIVFNEHEDRMVFSSLSNNSYLYRGKSGEVYLVSTWAGLLRQIKIIDGKMYVYTLDGNKWILDPIHEGGKYYFKKIDAES